MDKENILSNFQSKAKNAAPIGGVIKFEIDGNTICIDGSGSENKILLEDMAYLVRFLHVQILLFGVLLS